LPATELYNETALLTNLARGDEAAFRTLFDRHWDNIYGVAYALTKSPQVAEEMVHDIFLKIWQHRARLPELKNFSDYLFIIARNHIISVLRKKINEQPFTGQLLEYFQAIGGSPEEQLLYREAESLVQKAVQLLPPQQHTVYRLSREQGLNQEEIAARLNISVHTVKSHMNKALHFIRHYLQMHTGMEAYMILFCIISGLA
jgi:RNA polymerase sigma-70 factor, Bacteroides expansion family 1